MKAWPFGTLAPMKYGAILADMPSRYVMRSLKGHGKSPEAHYQTMPEAEIAALPVGQLASRNCMLFAWSTWPHLEQTLRIIRAWGFTYKTGGSWLKRTPSGKVAFGTGYILRSSVEPFLIATIGSPVTRSKSVRNFIDSLRREHSRKPPEMREMVDKLVPDVFACELFAREPWPGREVWGNETEKFSAAEPGADHDVQHVAAMGGSPVGGRGVDAVGRLLHGSGDVAGETGLGGLALDDETLDLFHVQSEAALGGGRHGGSDAAGVDVLFGHGGRGGKDQDRGEQHAHGALYSEPER